MALPVSITVVGRLLKVDGTPETGRVVFTSTVPVLHSQDESVLVPSFKVAALNTLGEFSISLPASDDPDWTPEGWVYRVSVQVSEIRYGFETVIPYDAPLGEINFSDLVPALDGGSSLYATFNHTHDGSGDVSWNELADKPSTFPPSSHTHDDRYFTEAEVTSSLAGKANSSHTHTVSQVTDLDYPVDSVAGKTGAVTLAVSDIPTLSTSLNSLDSRVTDLEEGSSGSAPVFVRARISSGDFDLPNDLSWAPVTGLTISIPAVPGDNVELVVSCLLDHNASISDHFEAVILNNGSIVRYGSTGTSSPNAVNETDPSIYPRDRFNGVNLIFNHEVASGDLFGGNVTFGLAHFGPGDGEINANANYPFRWHVVNYGQ